MYYDGHTLRIDWINLTKHSQLISSFWLVHFEFSKQIYLLLNLYHFNSSEKMKIIWLLFTVIFILLISQSGSEGLFIENVYFVYDIILVSILGSDDIRPIDTFKTCVSHYGACQKTACPRILMRENTDCPSPEICCVLVFIEK